MALDFIPSADNTDAVNFGNGTKDWDVKMFLGATTDFALFDISAGHLRFDNAEIRMGDNDQIEFGDSADVKVSWDGTNFLIDTAADDVILEIGDSASTQLSFDVKCYGNASSGADYILWDASLSDLGFFGAAYIRPKLGLLNKTGNYTVTAADFGKVLTTRTNGSALTFTLPAASGNEGETVIFINVADQNMIIAGQDEELVVFNDLTADSISFETGSEKIGGAFFAYCDGTSWLVVPWATETQTVTIASA